MATANRLALGRHSGALRPFDDLRRAIRFAAALGSDELRKLLYVCTPLNGEAPGLADLRDRALLLTCFAGGLRRCELVALDRADVKIMPEALILKIRESKADQEGRGRGQDPAAARILAHELREAEFQHQNKVRAQPATAAFVRECLVVPDV